MLELRSVSKRVGGSLHLSDISMTLEEGSLNVLLGPTLSGKTSLMRVMAGLDKPTDGAVFVDGEDVTNVPVQRRDIAMVYQQFINYPALTVYENIASPMRIAGKSEADIKSTIARVAALLKLEPFLDRLPLQLSGGQQQRTALARALAKNAKLVLLDEPLVNLDYKLREELRAELPKIFGESGAIFVYATAEPEEALLLGGRTATLSEGHVTQFGDTLDVYKRPSDLLTAKTFSDPPLNTLPVSKSGALFQHSSSTSMTVPPQFTHLADGEYTLAIRPHHLGFSDSVGRAKLSVVVSVTEITGSESFVHVRLNDLNWVVLTHGIHDPEPGTAVDIFADLSQLMVFDREGQAVASTLFNAAA
ncbi:MAG: ABC transporter ATP-binding protein [Pseudomonadota bacterium]